MALMLVGVVNLLGAYLSGVLGSRFYRPKLLSFIYVGRFLAISGLIAGTTERAHNLRVLRVHGPVLLSTVPITASLVASMFGTQYMSMLFGFVFSATSSALSLASIWAACCLT